MAFVGKPNTTGQSPQWDGTKWVTAVVSGSGGSVASASIGPRTIKLLNNVQANGSFPSTPVTNWTGSYVSTGNPCIFFVNATGYNSSTPALTTLYLKIDGTVAASSSLYFNNVEHHNFPTIIHAAQLSQGAHAIRLEITGVAGTGVADSTGDYANLTIVELSGSAAVVSLNTVVQQLAIAGNDSISSPSDKGSDVFFYVSGTIGSLSGSSNVPKKALFGGDVITSGTFSTALAPIFGPPPASSSWIPINTSGATILDENGSIFMSKPSGAGPNVSLLMMSSSKVPFKATAQFAFSPTLGSVAGLAGLYTRESTSGRLVGFGYHWDNGPVWRNYLHKLNNPTSANSDYVANNNTLFYPYIWLQVEDNGTNRIHRMSYDGKYFYQIHSITRTDFITADMVGWGIDTQGAAAQVRLISWRIE